MRCPKKIKEKTSAEDKKLIIKLTHRQGLRKTTALTVNACARPRPKTQENSKNLSQVGGDVSGVLRGFLVGPRKVPEGCRTSGGIFLAFLGAADTAAPATCQDRKKGPGWEQASWIQCNMEVSEIRGTLLACYSGVPYFRKLSHGPASLHCTLTGAFAD